MGSKRNGFTLVETLVMVAVIAVLGIVGYKVASGRQHATKGKGDVVWAFNSAKRAWVVHSGTAPACADPFTFSQSPVDLSKIWAIGMPGSYRGGDYKPHAALRLLSTDSGSIDVRMPLDATLVGLTRYYESAAPGDIQYLLTFENDCGIAFRFDHLFTLTPALQKIAETTPSPKVDDTRSDPNAAFPRTKLKAGDLVATAVGFPSTKNFGFDFGSYDYRQRNDISKNKQWVALHQTYPSTEWYGTCWITQLPAADQPKAKELALTNINTQKQATFASDYCSFAPHTTLDFNNGNPTNE